MLIRNLVIFSFLNFIHKISLQATNMNWLIEGKGWIHYIEYIHCIATSHLLVIYVNIHYVEYKK
jgi:hypothetical protein